MTIENGIALMVFLKKNLVFRLACIAIDDLGHQNLVKNAKDYHLSYRLWRICSHCSSQSNC